MDGLRVLLTNNALAARGGSELYTRDLATGLAALGHRPVVYSRILGDVAREIRRGGVPVIDDLATLAVPPDVVHGHHHVETMTALLRFPGVSAVFVCHGWVPWQEAPPRFPRVRHYVAVSELCRERLVSEHGVAAARVTLLANFVDLDRFQPRGALPPQPRAALLFGNRSSAASAEAMAVRRACATMGITVDVAGAGDQAVTDAPEALLPRYDLVFATGRCAHEALAVGCAVVVCCDGRIGPLVTTEDLDWLRRQNFGLRAACGPVTVERVHRAVDAYDPAEAAAVCRRVRAEAGRDAAVARLVDLYRQVMAEQAAAAPDLAAELRAASAYVRELGDHAKRGHEQAWASRQEAERLAAALQRTLKAARPRPPRAVRLARKCVRAVKRLTGAGPAHTDPLPPSGRRGE